MRTRLTSLAVAILATLIIVPAAGAATFHVDNVGTTADANPGDGTCATAGAACTLTAAIQESNALSTGAPHTIDFFVSAVSVPVSLPAITRNGTFIDGCNVGRTDPPFSAPRAPASTPCVDLLKTNVATTGLTVKDASGVVIQGLAMRNFPQAIHLWGADTSRIAGNRFGVKVDGTVVESNGVAIAVTGRTLDGTQATAATGNIIGGPSDAAGDPADCDSYCNTIVNSTVAGIDLVGTPSASGDGDSPAGGAPGDASEGTTIAGNWIGVRTAAGAASANATAIKIGNAQETMIGGADPDDGNVIAGNAHGVDQGSGATAVTLRWGVFGISPDGDITVSNGEWNARLTGGGTGLNPFVEKVTFGPAAVGLQFDGPKANLVGSVFLSPDSARFTTAAVRVGPGGDSAYIGTNTTTPFGCIPLLDTCNTIGATADGKPGLWIDGADDARIWRNAIGGGLSAPLQGPPIRIDGGAVGANIGDDDEDPERRNILSRLTGPAIEIGGGATKIVVGDNEGIAQNAFGDPAGLFTDLLPDPGPGNSGPANSNIQPPVITQASANGVGGTGTPGATIRVLQQQRAPVTGETLPSEPPEGYTFPTTPSFTTVAANGVWGVAFPAPVKVGNKLLASQTTADGSSEYAVPKAATPDNPPPLVTFTSGPPVVVDASVRTATFTFISNKAGSSFQCSLDAGAFVACASPYTVSGLETGGHQLQVKATDPIGKLGPPASRNWSILFADPAPAPTTPKGPTGSSAGTVKFASVVTLPSAKACISKRSLRITIKAPKGAKIKGTVVRISGRRVASVKNVKTIPVSLKGLKKGTFVVKVEVTLTDKRVLKGSRTYRTCAKKSAKKKSAKKR